VGANALVTEGKTFEDGSMIIGSPAAVKRKLSDGELAGLKISAAGYVHNHQRYIAKMREVG
jgi:carbonic anhydrase/acetyltransferase-like protein (isoleucine patch superfamily)